MRPSTSACLDRIPESIYALKGSNEPAVENVFVIDSDTMDAYTSPGMSPLC